MEKIKVLMIDDNKNLVEMVKEYFTNTIEEKNPPQELEKIESEIQGETEVYPYDIKTYTIDSFGGNWSINNKNAKILASSDSQVKIEIIAGRACTFDLIYSVGSSDYILPITVKSL